MAQITKKQIYAAIIIGIIFIIAGILTSLWGVTFPGIMLILWAIIRYNKAK